MGLTSKPCAVSKVLRSYGCRLVIEKRAYEDSLLAAIFCTFLCVAFLAGKLGY